MKNVTYQRGLVCISESEFQRILNEVSALENSKVQLEKQLKESVARVALLEEHIRVTEREALRAVAEMEALHSMDSQG